MHNSNSIKYKLLNTFIVVAIFATTMIPILSINTNAAVAAPKYCKETYNLKDGSTDVGDVEISTDGTKLYVKITTQNGWEFDKSYVDVGDSLSEIPKNPSGTPKYSDFTYKKTHDNSNDESYTYEITIASSDLSDLIDAYITVYTDVEKGSGPGKQTKDGWIEGTKFVHWSDEMYIKYTCNPATPTPTPTATPSVTPTPTPTPTEIPSPSVTPTPVPSVTPTPIPSEEPSPSVTPTPTDEPTPTPTPTPTPGPSSNIFVCKYNDEDKDGEWDKGEDGIANWDITITKSLPRAVEISEEIIEDQTEVIEVETGEDGCVDLYVDPYYTYKVEEVQKTGWVQTAPSDPSYCEAYITDYDKYDTRVGQIIDIIDENPTQETQTLYCDFGNYKERRSGGSGTQSGRNKDSSSTPVSTPRPTDSGDVLGEATTTTTPTPTQEVLVRTGFSILGIGAIGALNLQLGLLLNERFRRNIFSILSKII